MIKKEQLIDFISSMIKPLRNRVYMMISRAVLEAVKDDKNLQVIKINSFAGENRSDVERFQDYGFTSNPKPGAEAIVICPGGNREHMIAIKIDDRNFRLKSLESGEVAIYTDEGDKIHFKRGSIIEINGASKVDINSPLVEIGDGTLEKILNGETFQTRFNNHTHYGNAGVPTSIPIVPSPISDLSNTVKGAK